MVKIKIDDLYIEVEESKTILEAAQMAGIYIPNLCYHPDLSSIGACRLCLVEIEGSDKLVTACTEKVQDGMIVHTTTQKLAEYKKNIIWLMFSEYEGEMPDSSQFRNVVEYVGLENLLSDFKLEKKPLPVMVNDPLYIRDMNKCILCSRCVRICQDIRGVGAIDFIGRGIDTVVGTAYDESLMDADCKFCRACVEVCPSGALIDKKQYNIENKEDVLVPCSSTCPANIDVPRYIKYTAEGRFQDALEIVMERVPFPHVLGCVCPHPCEEACSRGEINEAIAIRALKKFIAEKDNGRWKSKIKVLPNTNKNVAIVGSGPAGLTAAWFLRQKGHNITVFESEPKPGGMMRMGIPRYRLPIDILNKEIENIEQVGVKIEVNSRIESIQELFDKGFDAIFLAVGASKGTKGGIEGENDFRVIDGLSILKSINTGKAVNIGNEVIVVGGGNVAMDVARSVRRLGAENVTVLYRRTRNEMPADPEEVKEALEEGVEFKFLTAPESIYSKNNKLSIKCIKMELGEADNSGRRRPIPIANSEFTIEADNILMAIGQDIEIPDGFTIDTDKKNRILIDKESMVCSIRGVFAGGDAVRGPATVIEAIEDGRKAASAIDKYLGGDGLIGYELVTKEEDDPHIGRDAGFAYLPRIKVPLISEDKRIKDFSQVECMLKDKLAIEEAKRCLKCQLRIAISSVPLPP